MGTAVITNNDAQMGALIFHKNSLLLLGGETENIEGYSAEKDTWVVAPYKLPEKLFLHYAFMMDLGEWTIVCSTHITAHKLNKVGRDYECTYLHRRGAEYTYNIA